jgi:inorganic pyrophosphatase
MQRLLVVLFVVLACMVIWERPRRTIVGGAPVSPRARVIDPETVVGPHHFTTGYPARNPDQSVNAVIEIPTGTTAKFEVRDDGILHWVHTREDGARREVDYLAYPVNYGMVPGTLAADGDPLDIVVLGRAIERGHVAHTRVIGVLEVVQGGVRDDKLIAVPLDADLRNGFSRLHEVDELDVAYPAARELLATWIANCWGRDTTAIVGWGDAAEASAILDEAMQPACSTRRVAAAPRRRAGSPSGAPAR